MKPLQCIGVSVLLCIALMGCSTEDVGKMVGALAKVPFVDRTEKEINDWLDNTTIIDDKPMTRNTAINGEPVVTIIHKGPKLTVNGTPYPGTLCITQTNQLPGGQSVKYAALAGIEVLNTPKLFQCGKVEISTTSCDGDPMAVNVAFGYSKATLEKAFRDAVDKWLQDDIVAMLKSSNNTDGNPASLPPRLPATTKGTMYNAFDSKGTRTMGFFAQ